MRLETGQITATGSAVVVSVSPPFRSASSYQVFAFDETSALVLTTGGAKTAAAFTLSGGAPIAGHVINWLAIENP